MFEIEKINKHTNHFMSDPNNGTYFMSVIYQRDYTSNKESDYIAINLNWTYL